MSSSASSWSRYLFSRSPRFNFQTSSLPDPWQNANPLAARNDRYRVCSHYQRHLFALSRKQCLNSLLIDCVDGPQQQHLEFSTLHAGILRASLADPKRASLPLSRSYGHAAPFRRSGLHSFRGYGDVVRSKGSAEPGMNELSLSSRCGPDISRLRDFSLPETLRIRLRLCAPSPWCTIAHVSQIDNGYITETGNAVTGDIHVSFVNDKTTWHCNNLQLGPSSNRFYLATLDGS